MNIGRKIKEFLRARYYCAGNEAEEVDAGGRRREASQKLTSARLQPRGSDGPRSSGRDLTGLESARTPGTGMNPSGGCFLFKSFLTGKDLSLCRDWKSLEYTEHKNHMEDKNKTENVVMEPTGRLHQTFVFSELILILDLLIIIHAGKR